MLNKEVFSNVFVRLKVKILDLIHNKTFLTCLALLVLYLISGYCKWIEILMCVSSIAAMIFLPINSGLAVLAFLHCFNLSNITYYSCLPITITGYTLILLVRYILGVKKKKYNVHKNILVAMLIFYVVWTIFSLWNLIYFPGFYYYIYLPLAYLLYAMRKEIQISQVMNYMLGGILVSSLFALIFQFFPHFQYDVFQYGRFRGFINNTNCLYIKALFILSYYMYRFVDNKLKPWQFILIYCSMSVISLMTISKTCIIMLAIISLLFVIFYLKDNFKKRIKVVLLISGIVLVVALIFREYIFSIVSRFTQAFKSGNVLDALFTDRTIIWKTYLKESFKNPFYALFGHGLLTKRINSLSIYGPPETHSLYIFMLHRFGIVGSVFIGYIIYLFVKKSNCCKPKLCAFLPLIYLFVEGLVENVFNAYSFIMFIFATMILFMNCEKSNSIENKNDIKTEDNDKAANLQ